MINDYYKVVDKATQDNRKCKMVRYDFKEINVDLKYIAYHLFIKIFSIFKGRK